jgi:hypothetical protein
MTQVSNVAPGPLVVFADYGMTFEIIILGLMTLTISDTGSCRTGSDGLQIFCTSHHQALRPRHQGNDISFPTVIEQLK